MRAAGFILVLALHVGVGAASDVLVFAGAGLRPVLDPLFAAYETRSGITVAVDYDGTGRLAAKIRAGHCPDLFIAAGWEWPQVLFETGHVTRWWPLAAHSPALVTSTRRPAIAAFYDITNARVRVAIGAPAACAIGRSTTQILACAGIGVHELNVVAEALTVVQLQQWVESGNADAGFIWDCDAARATHLQVVPGPEMCSVRDHICVCTMTHAPEPRRAAALATYVRVAAPRAFAAYGYHPVLENHDE